jgi:hypothetical protein
MFGGIRRIKYIPLNIYYDYHPVYDAIGKRAGFGIRRSQVLDPAAPNQSVDVCSLHPLARCIILMSCPRRCPMTVIDVKLEVYDYDIFLKLS